MKTSRFARFVLAALGLCTVHAAPAGEIIVDFFTESGTGFGDNTPVAPVGGNPGLTLGQQRIFVFLQAAAIWTEVLKPTQDIYVAAQFVPLAPNVLGSAGSRFIWSDFPGAELPNTWYFDSLADHLTQGDLSPPTYDIQANFSTNFAFYLGFDNDEPAGTVDLLAVVLHEMAHGLNFANTVAEATGAIPVPEGATVPYSDIYSRYTLDVTTNKRWDEMTSAERAASAINARKVSWNGVNANRAVPSVLARGEPTLRVNSPATLGTLMIGTAAFGAPLTDAGITGPVVAGEDAADATGPSPTDGCSPLTNNVAGAIVLLDRGTCGFTIKVKNAQNAGAIAVLIGDNVLALPPAGLGGTDPEISIPSARISLPDATAIRGSLASGSVNVTLKIDNSVLAGTDRNHGLLMLAALNPVQPGSSISHFEAVAFPNQLMEPAINQDLSSSVQPPQDLTLPLLTDLGWFTDRDGVLDGEDDCIGSNIAPTVVIGSCDSRASNDVLPTGCSVSDTVSECDEFRAGKPLRYLLCVANRTHDLYRGRVITRREQLAIDVCAIKSLR